MKPLPKSENAVAAIRVSSVKQGLQGDSPEDQKQQIERFAKSRGIKVKKFFIFMESASKEEQPIQEAIDYCTNPNNDIQLFIIKSIDRFTRGGSYLYDHLKRQLDENNVNLIDIYGIISSQQINTLDHLNVEYDWSVYSPTKKAEILEAERAKDEMRDIMTRMIGAEIRYVRMGYRVRRAPFGYKNEKVETPHGKRVILMPHPKESYWIKKMYQLKLEGTLTDSQIVEKLNEMGFKTRTFNRRDPEDRTKVIGKGGGNPLNLKQFWRFIRNPIYAGINIEKWTNYKPIKGQFEGLISIKEFNRANKGKVAISEDSNGEITIHKGKVPKHLANKKTNNPKFPFRKYVLCPKCGKPLYGSASKGKSGKYYPAYHCHHRGHYFRVPSQEFNETIESFVKKLKFTPEKVEELKEYVLKLWNEKQEITQQDNEEINKKIERLKMEVKAIAEKIRYLQSEVAIKYMEEDLIEVENKVKQLEQAKVDLVDEKDVNMKAVMESVGYYLEHLEDLVLDQSKPIKRAQYFSLLFDETPTYEELSFGTPNLAPFIELKSTSKGALVPNGDYQYLWNTENYPEGEYTLVGEAVDEHENKGKAKVEVKVVSEEKISPSPEPSPESTPTATATPSPHRFEQGESEPVRKDAEQEQAEEHRRDQENIPETLPTGPTDKEVIEEEVEEVEESIPEVTNLNQRNPKPTKKTEETNTETEEGMPEEVKEKAPGLDRGRVRGAKTIPFFVLIDRILSSL
jgi:site-specific DNA recombinase